MFQSTLFVMLQKQASGQNMSKHVLVLVWRCLHAKCHVVFRRGGWSALGAQHRFYWGSPNVLRAVATMRKEVIRNSHCVTHTAATRGWFCCPCQTLSRARHMCESCAFLAPMLLQGRDKFMCSGNRFRHIVYTTSIRFPRLFYWPRRVTCVACWFQEFGRSF